MPASKTSVPKFYGPLADKLLRAYLSLPEDSPVRARFEALMVETEDGVQHTSTPASDFEKLPRPVKHLSTRINRF